jgi:transposase-like protein
VTAEQFRHALNLLARPGNTVSSTARLLGVSRATIYKCVPGREPGPPAAPPARRTPLESGAQITHICSPMSGSRVMAEPPWPTG